MEDNVALIYTHGAVTEDTKMVSKEVMDMFPGKVYILTLAPYGGLSYLKVFPFFIFLFQIGGVEFVRELIDFINRKPPTMEATVEYMEDNLFKTSYHYGVLIYIFIISIYEHYYHLYGDIIHDIFSVYTKAHPPPNIYLNHNNDIAARTNREEYRDCLTTPKTKVLRSVYFNAKDHFYIDPEIDRKLELYTNDYSKMYIGKQTGNSCYERLDSIEGKAPYHSYNEEFKLPMGIYSNIVYDLHSDHMMEYDGTNQVYQTDTHTQLFFQYLDKHIYLEDLLSSYSTDAIGDTYIVLFSCKYLSGYAEEEIYQTINPMLDIQDERLKQRNIGPSNITVKRRLIPKEKLESIYTKYGRTDVPAYTARQVKIRPLSYIHSTYNPYTYTPQDASIINRSLFAKALKRLDLEDNIDIPKSLRRAQVQPSLKRVQSRRRDLPVKSITVDASTISNTPSLLYILRKSMHHCFPDMYTDPDIDTSKTVSWFSRRNPMSLWNPQNDIVLFFTRIGGTEMSPRLFFEIEDSGTDTLKISNLCSTHLAPLGIKKKERFVKAALNLWVGSNNNNYTIQADIYNKDPYDKDISRYTDKLLHIITASDGGSLHIEDVDTDYKGGILYKLELPKGSFEQDVDIMPRTIDPSSIRMTWEEKEYRRKLAKQAEEQRSKTPVKGRRSARIYHEV